MDFPDDIRPSIRETVDSLLWLESVGGGDLASLSRSHDPSKARPERCVICTLPYGLCEHNDEWIAEHMQERMMRGMQSELEDEINDVLDVLKFSPLDITTAPVADDVDLEHMKWQPLAEQLTDKIGATSVKLFIPDRRAWHTTTAVGEKAVLVFGGMRSKDDLPQPFNSSLTGDDIEILGDLRVYDLPRRCWVGSKARPTPPPRFGHCAVSLTDYRLLIFGGRGDRNKLYSDVWVFYLDHDRWEQIAVAADVPQPAPRFHCDASSAVFPNSQEAVYVFGGTNGLDNFDDLWILQVCPVALCVEATPEGAISTAATWVRGAAVGVSPSARYGHRMTYCPALHAIVVSGGCAMSPQSELVGHTNSVDTNIELMHLTNVLQSKYRQESDLAVVASEHMKLRIQALPSASQDLMAHGGGRAVADLLKDNADVSAQLHLREVDTRIAEQQLVDAYKRSQAVIQHNGRHKNSSLRDGEAKLKGMAGAAARRDGKMEAFCLKLKGVQDLVWQEFCFPHVQGDIPDSRVFHGAACIGNFLFVMGGGEPTSLVLRHVDRPRPGMQKVPNGDFTPLEVFVLDLTTRAWRHHQPINSLSLHQDLLRLSERDIAKARREVEQAALTAKTLGLPRGQRTREQGLADALLNVCIWRRDTLFQSIERAQLGSAQQTTQGDALAEHALSDYLYHNTKLDERVVAMSYDIVSPYTRLGGTLCAVRQRLVLVGGFPAPDGTPNQPKSRAPLMSAVYKTHQGAQAYKYRAMVLDVEQDLERRRRQEEEHYSQLEEERRRIEADENIQKLLTEHEIRELVVHERKNREREQAMMTKMDFLSSLAPLSRPGKVALEKANRHTLWLRWDRVYRDTRGKLVSEDGVVYFLYLRIGFEHLPLDCKVAVLPRELETNVPRSTTLGLGLGLGLHLLATQRVKPKSRSSKKNKRRMSMGNDPTSMLNQFMVFDDVHTRFAGRICKIWGDGTFDVKFEDGAFEAHIPRHRIRRAEGERADSTRLFPDPSASSQQSTTMSVVTEDDSDNDSLGGGTFSTATGSRSRKLQRVQEKQRKLRHTLETKFRRPVAQLPEGGAADPPVAPQRRSSSHLFEIQQKSHTYYRLLVSGEGDAEESDHLEVQSCLSNTSNLPPSFAALPIRDDNSEVTADASHINHAIRAYTTAPVSSASVSVASSAPGDWSVASDNTPAPLIPTVVVSPEWRLVYVGSNNGYACTSLVPDHVLLQEKHLKIPVIAALQTLGLDHPRYERSQLSSSQAFFTLSEDEIGMGSLDDDTRTVDSRSLSSDTTASTATLSRTKREIISAVLQDQQVCRIERLAQSCSSEGLGEDYL